jgi:hypothetical protein
MSTRVELKGNRFAPFIHSECDSSFSNAARVFRPTIVVVMNAARVINFDPVSILRYLNRSSGNDDHMSSIPGILGRSLQSPSDDVAPLRIANLPYRFPPG